MKTNQMPTPARLIAGCFGFTLTTFSVILLLRASEMDWKIIVAAIIAAGLGCDLLTGAIRGRWPVSALLWLVP